MSMRAALPYLLAAVLGVAAAALVACGSSGSSDRKELIPPRSADRLRSALSDVRSAVNAGNCDSAAQAVARARGVLVNLPRAVDDRLVSRLREGIDNLQKIAPDECAQQDTTTSTETTTETTTPETTSTPSTATTSTTTTPTTSTSTTTTTTTPPTTGTTTTTPPATTTTAPADPSGGTTTP
jgi:cell division septation protein DedD